MKIRSTFAWLKGILLRLFYRPQRNRIKSVPPPVASGNEPPEPARSLIRPTPSSPITCRIVWDDEPSSSSPWIDPATAAALILDASRRKGDSTERGDRIKIVVVGASRIETHVFRRVAGKVWPMGLDRESFRFEPVGMDAASIRKQLEFADDRSSRDLAIVAGPSLGKAQRLAMGNRGGSMTVVKSDQLGRTFAKLWASRASKVGPGFAVDYRLSYPRSRWATTVPHHEEIRSMRSGLYRVYHLDTDGCGEDRLVFEVEQRLPDGSEPRTWTIGEHRFLSDHDRVRVLELDACPASGAVRFVVRSKSNVGSESPVPGEVIWPIAAIPSDVKPSPGTLPVSVCLAVDRSTAARAGAEVAPLVDRLRKLGRLARLQVVWTDSDLRHWTREWSIGDLEASGGSFRIEPLDGGIADPIRCRGLSGAIRESLWHEGAAEASARPAVGLVIVDRDYRPGDDRAFATIEARWAWFLQIRRILGGPIALLASRLDRSDEPIDPILQETLQHLVILGRQSTTIPTSALVPSLKPGILSDVNRLGVEVEAILAIADRMDDLGQSEPCEHTESSPLFVIEPDDRRQPRKAIPASAGVSES